MIDLDTTIRGEEVANVLSKLSEKQKVLETDVGYGVYCKDVEEATPQIVRSLDMIGVKAMKESALKYTKIKPLQQLKTTFKKGQIVLTEVS